MKRDIIGALSISSGAIAMMIWIDSLHDAIIVVSIVCGGIIGIVAGFLLLYILSSVVCYICNRINRFVLRRVWADYQYYFRHEFGR